MSIYCGREFNDQDIQTINQLMAQDPALRRAPMSRQLCQLWGWTKPNGELKDMTCRVALLRMQADGLITLPPSRLAGFTPRRKPHFPPTPWRSSELTRACSAKLTQRICDRVGLRVVAGISGNGWARTGQ